MRILAGIVAAALLAGAGGYYIGFDHGFEFAKSETVTTAETMESIRAHIGGLWRSRDDAHFTREFRDNGLAIDAYSGSNVIESRFTLFTKEAPPEGYSGQLEEGAVYLSMGMIGEAPSYFRISEWGEHELELVYLESGGVLAFQRVQ